MAAIQNHDELRTFLRQHGWTEYGASHWQYKNLTPRFRLSIFINTIDTDRLTVYELNGEVKRNFIYSYTFPEENYELTERILSYMKRYNDGQLFYEERKNERVNAMNWFYDTCCIENDLNIDEQKDCSVCSLSNGMNLYFFHLPWNNGIELVVPSNHEETHVFNYTYEFTKKGMDKLDTMIKSQQLKVPFLNTWVTPVTKESVLYKESVLSFEKKEGMYGEQAKLCRQLISKRLPTDWTFHLFVFSYMPLFSEHLVEFQFVKHQGCKGATECISSILESLVNAYDFFTCKEKLYHYDSYLMDLKQVDEETFVSFLCELKERVEPVFSRFTGKNVNEPTA